MSKKQYYFFYTSLKDISPDEAKLQISVQDWIGQAQEELTPEDMNMINSLRYHTDNKNLLNLLEQKNIWLDGGVFTQELLADEIKDPQSLPEYMIHFITKFRENEREFPNLSLENELTIYYYRHLKSLPNQFFADFVAFDFNMTNTIAALNARKYKLYTENNVLLLDPESNQLRESNAPDFGLTHNYSWMSDLLVIFENPNLMEREKQLMMFRYQYIEEQLLYEYFSAEKVIGYYIKLLLIERMQGFDPIKGKEIFQKITNELSDANKLFKRLEL